MNFMRFLLFVVIGFFLHNLLFLAGAITASLVDKVFHTNKYVLAIILGLHIPYFISGFLLAKTNGVVWPRLVALCSASLVSCVMSANSHLKWREEQWIAYAPPVLTSIIGASVALYLIKRSQPKSVPEEVTSQVD